MIISSCRILALAVELFLRERDILEERLPLPGENFLGIDRSVACVVTRLPGTSRDLKACPTHLDQEKRPPLPSGPQSMVQALATTWPDMRRRVLRHTPLSTGLRASDAGGHGATVK